MSPNAYVERRGEAWHVAGSRVSVDSLVYAFREGLSPEAIARECFPNLALEQVYGAITFYLANRREFDASLRSSQARNEESRMIEQQSDQAFVEKMARARRDLLPAG